MFVLLEIAVHILDIHPGVADVIEGDDLQRFAELSTHAGRSLRHPGNRQSDDFRSLGEHLFDDNGRNVTFHDVTTNLGRVARTQLPGNTSLQLDTEQFLFRYVDSFYLKSAIL